MDVGEDTAGSDGYTAQELVEFLVVADGKLHVAGDDAALLVVTGGVPGELEDLGGQVLEDSGEVHGGTGADTGSVAALLEETCDTSDGELKPGLGTAGCPLLASTATFAFSCSHFSWFRFGFTVWLCACVCVYV